MVLNEKKEKFVENNDKMSFVYLTGLPYDIGYGQRLFLRCRGSGAPTGFSFHNQFDSCSSNHFSFSFSYFRWTDRNEFRCLASIARKFEKVHDGTTTMVTINKFRSFLGLYL